MKLAILSCSPKCYSTRRLREAADQRGHKVKVLNTVKFAIDLEEGAPDLYFRRKRLSHYDAVLPRIGASITYFGTAVVRQFEQMDVFCANSSAGISNSRDKLRSLQILSRHHIGIPETTFVRDKKDVLAGDRARRRRAGDHQAAGRHAGDRGAPGGVGEVGRGHRRTAAESEAERVDPEVRRREQGPGHPGLRGRRPGGGRHAPRGPGAGVPQQRPPGRPDRAGGPR